MPLVPKLNVLGFCCFMIISIVFVDFPIYILEKTVDDLIAQRSLLLGSQDCGCGKNARKKFFNWERPTVGPRCFIFSCFDNLTL